MNFTTARLLQQVRLWIYGALMVWGGIALLFTSDRHDGTGAVVLLSAIILTYLETCPQCGRLVWKEGDSHWWTFWLILPKRGWWIGTECREPKPTEKAQ